MSTFKVNFGRKTTINDAGKGTLDASTLSFKKEPELPESKVKADEIPDDLSLMQMSGEGNMLSIETLSRLTGLSPYKLRTYIKDGRLPFASYVPSESTKENGRGTFLISYSGFKRWLETDLTGNAIDIIKQRVRSYTTVNEAVSQKKVYPQGDAKLNLLKQYKDDKSKGVQTPELFFIIDAMEHQDEEKLIAAVCDVVEAQVEKYLEDYDVRTCVQMRS